jgi:hypothetical protein
MSDIFNGDFLTPDEEREADKGALQNLIATKYFGYSSFTEASKIDRTAIRQWMDNFFAVVSNIPLLIEQLEEGDFSLESAQGRVLTDLYEHPDLLQEFVKSYVQVVDFNFAGDNTESETAGYQLQYLITHAFDKFFKEQKAIQEKIDPFNYIDEQIKLMSMGDVEFTPYFEHLDSYKRVRDMYLGDGERPGKFRDDQPPAQIAPYQCRIGASTFFVPPTSISVHQAFTSGSLTNGVLRAPNSPKMNLGHSQTEITMTLYFPNHETIWGFNGSKADFDIFNWDPKPIVRKDREQVSGQQQVAGKGTTVSDAVIDRYLSSLRGLITQFKYAPFLPIVNQYLNRSYDITAVCLQSLTVNTVPDFPFVLAVNLNLTKFNYKPFLPMITNFDQAIHWGKYRQYMGKAAARLDAKVNQGFLVEKPTPEGQDPPNIKEIITVFEGDLLPTFDKVKDIANGAFFDFYYPITTPSRIFAPDTTDFRQPGEDNVITTDIWDGILSSIGLDVIEPPQFDFFEYDRAYRGSKFRNERRVLHNWLQLNNLAWKEMTPAKFNIFIEEAIALGKRNGEINTSNESWWRDQLKREWFYLVFEKVMDDDKGFQDLIRSRDFQNSNYTIKEWTVPMEKLYIDWTSCIVNNVSVSLSNNFAQMQVQLQDEPTYQHIGGGDSRVEVSMTVLGEENLVRFRRLFEHINGLARIEKVHGVLGFLGIKNVITSLCGIKYVLPLDLEVNTVPGYPHVYSVNMSFIDFDIMQQEREKLSTAQQKSFIDQFGKRNPFLRLKQSWGAFNAYPDMPLDVRDEDGEILGHLDADWYFRSFTTSQSDEDIFSWGFDETVSKLVNNIARLKMRLLEDGISLVEMINYEKNIKEAEEELRTLVGDGTNLPGGWKIVDGRVVVATDSDGNDMPEPEMIIRLGLYDKDQQKSSFVAFFVGGYMALGYEDVATGKKTYQMGMSTFNEDLASKNLNKVPSLPGTVGLSDYQTELVGGGTNANIHYESMMKDYDYRNMRGRMLKAFPTYMLWLIDEGGKFAGIKLFDNFYGLNSVIDFSVLSSQNAIEDTLVLRLSNIYNKLTTPYKDQLITEDDPLFNTATGQWIFTTLNRSRNLESGMTDTIIELNSIRLKPGVRIHLRGGYGSNPNNLQTLFNGVIAEVQPGDIMTVVAQSDAVEFTGYVNTINTKGHTGKLDGGLSSFWLSEPRDLMVRLLSMGSSNFKEWLAWGSKGVFYSDSRFGIRHFGTILYESMTDTEITGNRNVQRGACEALNGPKGAPGESFQGVLGDYAEDLASITSITGLSSAFNGNLIKIGKMLWLNQFAKRDYEIFKRNIYPGNGSGIAQFMGGDMIDAGVTITSATAYYDSTTASGASGEGYGASQHPIQNSDDPTDDAANEAIRESNEKDVIDLWTQYENNVGVTDDELDDMFTMSNTGSSDLTIKEKKSEGLLESIFTGVGDIVTLPFDLLDGVHDLLSELPGGGFTATVLELFAAGFIGGPLGLAIKGYTLLRGTSRLVMGALGGGSGLAHILGLTSGIDDDDLNGFDEVSFRAQTYMKTVWDLFNVCAALLPNYIVAVRPFEDRSTVFYGKPHWLYTSGVIPITTGVPKDRSALPRLEGEDNFIVDALNKAKQFSNNNIEKMMGVIDESNSLKDIMSLSIGRDIDPYKAGGDLTLQLSTAEDLQNALELLPESEGIPTDLLITAVEGLDFTAFTPQELATLFGPSLTFYALGEGDLAAIDFLADGDEEFIAMVKQYYQEKIDAKKAYLEYKMDNPNAGGELEDDLGENKPLLDQAADYLGLEGQDDNYFINIDTQIEALAKTDQEKADLKEFYYRDPITFAYHFGWKINSIPIWYDPSSGYGTDKVGSLARALYDEGFSTTVDAVNDERSLGEGNDIWGEFRNTFRSRGDVKDAYIRFYPMPDQEARFDAVVDLFQRYMWQDPYNRAWIVNIVDKVGDGLGDTLNPFGDNSDHWSWTAVVEAWRQFLADSNLDIDDETGEIRSSTTSRYIKANQTAGKDAKNFFSGVTEDITTWVDDNVGQLIGLISDTITGFVASIRMSLMQMSTAVSAAGDMQRQANVLNSSLNNSIYYQWGAPGSLQRLVDNPFTREYGEPVIEVREPFQRMHFVSSFDTIIDNKITENLNGVATVVTAVSDGKYPVTVHFDKAISPERQVEKVVETGLLWDNAVGSGLFGFLQPLLHPLETLRAYSKTVTGSSDQLSARRIALWHLKQSLQNIYMGEIIIIGDADIRPYDLLYIADVYERMYGMVEVQQVTHHFTPETGFITSIVPNAIVTINDPVRWTFLSYMWSKMTNYNLRDDVRAMMNINIERSIADGTKGLFDTEVYKNFSTQINGAIQHTQGSTALIRDIGAMFSGGGLEALSAKDRAITQVAKIDMTLGFIKSGGTLAGAIGGSLIGGPAGGIVGATAAWAVTDLLWEGWQWVKENLLDQHGCYIQYLNKDGQPMDAGLSVAQGVAVGTNHTVSLFPSIVGLSGKVNIAKDGHYRITINDMLGSLGYSEIETLSIYRDTSMFVNQINAEILKISGRDTIPVGTENYIVVKANVLDVNGENIDSTGRRDSGVEDGDTLNVRIVESVEGFTAGQIVKVRLSFINTYELEYHDDDTTSFNETDQVPYNDMGKLAYDYLVARFSTAEARKIVLRINRRDPKDHFGRTIATVFHNTPLGTPQSERLDVLKSYAQSSPAIPIDSYLEDGRPYTLNWEMVMTGYGAIDMRESLWDTTWRRDALDFGEV